MGVCSKCGGVQPYMPEFRRSKMDGIVIALVIILIPIVFLIISIVFFIILIGRKR